MKYYHIKPMSKGYSTRQISTSMFEKTSEIEIFLHIRAKYKQHTDNDSKNNFILHNFRLSTHTHNPHKL
jgi:hypothetical protein